VVSTLAPAVAWGSSPLTGQPDTCPVIRHTFVDEDREAFPNETPVPYAERLQGIAHDARNWYFAEKGDDDHPARLWKLPLGSNLNSRDGSEWLPGAQESDLPPELAALRYNHYGDLDYFAGFLFVPLEGPPGVDAAIAAFRPDNLELVDLAVVSQAGNAGLVAINPGEGEAGDEVFLYSDARASEAKLFRYKLEIDTLRTEASMCDRSQAGWAQECQALEHALHCSGEPEEPCEMELTDAAGGPLHIERIQGGVFSPWGDLALMTGGRPGCAVICDVPCIVFGLEEGCIVPTPIEGTIQVFRDGRLIQTSVNDEPDAAFSFENYPAYDISDPALEEAQGLDWWSLSPVVGGKLAGELHALLVDLDVHNDNDLLTFHYYVDYSSCTNGARDTDGDTLSDHDEVYVHNTHPLVRDTDFDGIPDGLEVQLKDTLGNHPLVPDTDLDGTLDGDEDSDNDGLINRREVEHNTDLTDPDTDHDLLNDGTEVLGSNPTKPLVADTDGDDLGDGVEDANRNGDLDAGESNPNDADSDDDHLSDGTEALGSNPTNPLDPDSDHDGLLDGTEDANHNGALDSGETNPNDPDTDDDRLFDGTEVEFGTDPLRADSDGDGIIDGQDVEWIQNGINALPVASFKGPGHRAAMLAQLDTVERHVAAGRYSLALAKLADLRQNVDGCGAAADKNDWIVECPGQLQIRGILDLLSQNLS
jgi:hypothetical protein